MDFLQFDPFDSCQACSYTMVFTVLFEQLLKKKKKKWAEPSTELHGVVFLCHCLPHRTHTQVLSLAGATASIIFVVTKIFCRNIILSRQEHFCRDKRRVLMRQTRVFCRDKNDTCGSSRQ